MNRETKTGEKRKIDVTGEGLSANIESLTFYNDMFGVTFGLWLELPIEKLEELGRFVANTSRGFEGENPEGLYDKKWKMTIEEAESE